MGINNLILALSSKSLSFFSLNKGFGKTYTDRMKTSIGIKDNEVFYLSQKFDKKITLRPVINLKASLKYICHGSTKHDK